MAAMAAGLRQSWNLWLCLPTSVDLSVSDLEACFTIVKGSQVEEEEDVH